jgi:hypothetical protein
MTQTVTLTVPQVLHAAADELELAGWTQGHYHDIDGRRDALGALAHIAECDPTYTRTETFNTAERHLLAAIDSDSVIDWNDDPERTRRDVVAAFHKAEHAANTETATNDAAA